MGVAQGADIGFLSTLSLRRATYLVRGQRPSWEISIHALLAESDDISGATNRILRAFLSTLSLRRATQHFNNLPIKYIFLSTLSLRRATSADCNCRNAHPISIHALLAESDLRVLEVTRNAITDFYPRSPCGERRRFLASWSAVLTISIHALLAESD